MKSFFEMYHVMEGLMKRRGNSAAALSSDGDDRPNEPAFIPSQQTDGERERAQSGMQRNREMDDLVTQAYRKAPQSQGGGLAELMAKRKAKVNKEVDPEGELPGYMRKHNAHVSSGDIRKNIDPEVAEPLLQQRNQARSLNRVPDQLMQFNQFTSNRGYHDFMVSAMKTLGYDVPNVEGNFPQNRIYMTLKPSGRENEVVVSPEHAQKIMRDVNNKMSSRRDTGEKAGYEGNFRDKLSQLDAPEARLALKLDNFFTKDQMKSQNGRGPALIVGKPMGAAELMMHLANHLGSDFASVQAAMKLLHKEAPFLFEIDKSDGETKIVVKRQGNAKDREDQQVFSKPEPVKQYSGQSVGQQPTKKKPEKELQGLEKYRPEINKAITGQGDPEKALKIVNHLLQSASDDDRAELEGFRKELESMRESVYWVNMTHLVEASTPRF